MRPRNAFTDSQPVADTRRTDGDHTDFDLTNWNDTPPHENGEGWDGKGLAAPTGAVAPAAPARGAAQPYACVQP